MPERLPVTRRGPLAVDGADMQLRFAAFHHGQKAEQEFDQWLLLHPDCQVCEVQHGIDPGGFVIRVLYYEPMVEVENSGAAAPATVVK